MTRFPWSAVLQVAAGFAVAVAGAHLLEYDPTEELPAASAAAEPRARMRALPSARGEGERRVFFLGASMTAGYPYMSGEACYARQMHAGLQAVHPDAGVFVHEYAKPALDSRELADMVDLVLERYDPSLVCVALGSNEFANRVFSGKYMLPQGAIAQLGERASRARVLFRRLPQSRIASEDALQSKLQKRLEKAVIHEPRFGALPIPQRERALILRRMRRMMQRMSEACAARGVPLVFVLAVYGVGGFWPWGESGEVNPGLDALIERTWLPGFDAEEARSMRAYVEELASRFPQRADVQFLHGIVLRELGEDVAARTAFENARDLDTVPMHQTGAIRDVILEAARALGRTCFVLDDAFAVAGSALPDVREYLDYGHLSHAGNRRAAAWLAEGLVREGQLPPWPEGEWRARFDAAAEAHVRAHVSQLSLESDRANMAASNAGFSMLLGNFRDAVPWLEESVRSYPWQADRKWRLVQCLTQLNGFWEERLKLSQEERKQELVRYDREIVQAVAEKRLWDWILRERRRVPGAR